MSERNKDQYVDSYTPCPEDLPDDPLKTITREDAVKILARMRAVMFWSYTEGRWDSQEWLNPDNLGFLEEDLRKVTPWVDTNESE